MAWNHQEEDEEEQTQREETEITKHVSLVK